jgi:benzoyl-CoA reductase/2-hydroxyglutaryl-CoA dehydratase subunit BcrC/BadD/HgdB
MYETLCHNIPGVWVDVPPYINESAQVLAIKEIHEAAQKLSDITGIPVTNDELRKYADITNECKDLSEKLIEMALGPVYPIHPITFSQILSIIEISFQDYLSDPLHFRDLLRDFYHDFSEKIQSGQNCYNVEKVPRILFTSRFGGWDHIVENYVFENGGRVIYADWLIYGFMHRIKTTGDMFENYAEYIQQCGVDFGLDNVRMVERIVDFIRRTKIEGVIFNQLFGCHSLSTVYYRLRKFLMQEEIPSTLVSFNNINENREQLKTRVVALMELILH